MKTLLNNLLARIWKRLGWNLRWRILWLYHDKFVIGVSGIIFNEGKQVLLLKHRYWAGEAWGLPSGHIEHGESLEAALIREIREETGYEVEIDQILQVASGLPLRLEATFSGHITGGQLQLDPTEILAARFFPPDELPDDVLEAHQALVRMLVGE